MTPSSSRKTHSLFAFTEYKKRVRALHVLERVKAEHVSALKTRTMVGRPGAFGSGET